MSLKSILASRRFHTLLGVGVSVAILAALAVTVEWSEVAAELSGANFWMLVPMTLLGVLGVLLRAARWRHFLRESQDDSFMHLFDSLMLGNLATFLLPLRAGEFVRPYALTWRSRHSFADGLSSVVIERFFDLSVVLLTFGLMVVYLDNVPAVAQQGAVVLALLAGAILAFIAVGSVAPQLVLRIAGVPLKLLPAGLADSVHRFLDTFLEGTRVLHGPWNLLRVTLYSAAVWLSTFCYFGISFYAVGIPGTLWMGASAAVLVGLALAAPSAPGFLGVYQAGCLATFLLFGLDKEAAVAYSILTHVHQYLIVVGYGFVVLLKLGLSFGSLTTMREQIGEP